MWGQILGTAASVGLDLYKNHQATEHADFWNQQNIALQKEFAQNSIKWRVEDAKRAGVHPMAALGIQGSSFSPVSTSIPTASDSSYLADMGQNIDRAIMAGKDKDAQQEAESLNTRMNQIKVDTAEVELDMKRAELASMLATRSSSAPIGAPPTDPAKVSDAGGGPDGKMIDPTPMKVTPTNSPGKEPASNPGAGYIENPNGSVTTVQSEVAKERLEEDWLGSLIWMVNNRFVPHVKTMFGRPPGVHEPPRSMLPKGAVRWAYDGYGSWIPVDAAGNDMTKTKDGIMNRINQRFK